MYYLCKKIVFRRSSSICRISERNLLTYNAPIQYPSPPLVFDYLVNTFGFSTDKAIKASKYFSRSASLSSLSAVPDFFKQSLGLSDAQITTIISTRPRLLSSNVEETLKPKLKCLEHLGFSGTSLASLISTSPTIILSHIDNSIIPTIKFLRSLQHSNEDIINFLKKCHWCLAPEYRKNISFNIEILHQYGVPDKQITRSLLQKPRLFIQKPECIKGIVAQVDEFGVKHDSGLFLKAVEVIGGMRKASIDSKFELYKSYGWSELDIISAFRKYPTVLGYSDQNIRATMSFLMEEVGCKPIDISFRPILLGCSLEKVLKPRNEVLNTLISRGLIKKKPSFISVVLMSKEKFIQKYIAGYADVAPDLLQLYNGSQSRD